MSIHEIESKIRELRQLQTLVEEAETEMETIKDAIKYQLTAQGVDELRAGEYKVTWNQAGQQGPESGSARGGGAFLQDHHPPLLRGMRRSRYPDPSKHG